MLECPWTISFKISDTEWFILVVAAQLYWSDWGPGLDHSRPVKGDSYKGKRSLETDMNRSNARLDPFRVTGVRNYHSSKSYMQMKILNQSNNCPQISVQDWYDIIMDGTVQSNLWNHPSWGRIERQMGRNCEEIPPFTP